MNYSMNTFLPPFLVASQYDVSNNVKFTSALFGIMAGENNAPMAMLLANEYAKGKVEDAPTQTAPVPDGEVEQRSAEIGYAKGQPDWEKEVLQWALGSERKAKVVAQPVGNQRPDLSAEMVEYRTRLDAAIGDFEKSIAGNKGLAEANAKEIKTLRSAMADLRKAMPVAKAETAPAPEVKKKGNR